MILALVADLVLLPVWRPLTNGKEQLMQLGNKKREYEYQSRKQPPLFGRGVSSGMA